MSVITRYETRICLSPNRLADQEVDPTWALMEQAVEATAQELGGSPTRTIHDAFGQSQVCHFGLVTPDFPRGVGIRVESTGNVVFLYDHYDEQGRGYRRAASEICRRISQNYTALAVAKALREMEYSIEVEEAEEESGRAVVVRGRL